MSVAKVVGLNASFTMQQRLISAPWHLQFIDASQVYLVTRRPKIITELHPIGRSDCWLLHIWTDGKEFVHEIDPKITFGGPIIMCGESHPGHSQFDGEGWWIQLANRSDGEHSLVFVSHHELAVRATGGLRPLTLHEVLYVGRGASPNAHARLLRHPTLQKIYADNQSKSSDIFLTYLELIESGSAMEIGNDASIEIGSKSLASRMSNQGPDGFVQRQAVELAEAAIISHFRPAYNKQLLSFPKGRSRVSKAISSDGYTKLVVSMNIEDVGIRAWSSSRPKPARYVPIALLIKPEGIESAVLADVADVADRMLASTLEMNRKAAEREPIRFSFISADGRP